MGRDPTYTKLHTHGGLIHLRCRNTGLDYGVLVAWLVGYTNHGLREGRYDFVAIAAVDDLWPIILRFISRQEAELGVASGDGSAGTGEIPGAAHIPGAKYTS